MSYKMECAACGSKVNARFDFCSKCNKQFTELFGANWYALDWALEMRDSHRHMVKLEAQEVKTLDADSIYARSSTVSLEEWSASTDIDGRLVTSTGSSNHYTIPTTKKRKNELDQKIASYVRQGFGYKKVYKLLVAEYGEAAVPSLGTIQRRINEFRGR